jgi:membrane fusion protein, cation efflux system
MKPLPLISSILAASLTLSAPTLVFAHVGHGDEFQSQGGTQRVKVNAESDQMLGILVAPIAQAAEGGAGVMVPVTSLVDADGKQLVFVQYKDFYEPVPVTTGATKGELIEVTQGLSVGEKLVTQGSLSLYAESRKTKTAEASPSPAAIATTQAASPDATTQATTSHAQADAQGLPHSHNAAGNMAQLPSDGAEKKGGFPIGLLAAVGGGAVVLVGAIALMGTRKKKGGF